MAHQSKPKHRIAQYKLLSATNWEEARQLYVTHTGTAFLGDRSCVFDVSLSRSGQRGVFP